MSAPGRVEHKQETVAYALFAAIDASPTTTSSIAAAAAERIRLSNCCSRAAMF
jgi:hypothetical protein